MQDDYTSTWDFTGLLSLSFCHTAHTALGEHPTDTTAPAVVQQGGNVFLRDWDVKILAPGSDAAVTRVYCVASGIFNECDVLTTVRSARSASLALAAFVRVSVPGAMGPLPAVTQAGSLLVARMCAIGGQAPERRPSSSA